MVSALVSGSSGPGSSPGWGHCVLWPDTLLSQGLSPPRCYKWVLRNLLVMLRVTLQWTSILSKGGVEIILLVTSTGINSGLMGHLAHMQT